MKRREKVAPLMVALMVIASFTQLLADGYDPIQKDEDSIDYETLISGTILLGNLIGDKNSEAEIIFATSDNRIVILNQQPLNPEFIITTKDRVLGIQVADIDKDELNELIFWTKNELFIYNNKPELLFSRKFDNSIDSVVCLDANSSQMKNIIVATGKQIMALSLENKIVWEYTLTEKSTNLFVSNIDDFSLEDLIITTEKKIAILSYAGGMMEEIDFSPESISKTLIMDSNNDEKIIVLSYLENQYKFYKINSKGDKTIIYKSADRIMDFTFGIVRADSNKDEYVIFWVSNGEVRAIDLNPYTKDKNLNWIYNSKKSFVNVETVDLDNREIPAHGNTNFREIIISCQNGDIYVYPWYYTIGNLDVPRRTYKSDFDDVIFSKIISKSQYFPKILLQISSKGKFQKYWLYFDEFYFLQGYDNANKYYESENYGNAKFFFNSCVNNEKESEIAKYYGVLSNCQEKLENIESKIKEGESENIKKLRNGLEEKENQEYLSSIDKLLEVYKFYKSYGYGDENLLDPLNTDYKLKNLREDIWLCGFNILRIADEEKESDILKLYYLLKIYPSFDIAGISDLQWAVEQNKKLKEFEGIVQKYGTNYLVKNIIEEILFEIEDAADLSFKSGNYGDADYKYSQIIEAGKIIYGENSEFQKKYSDRIDEIHRIVLRRNMKYIFFSLIIIAIGVIISILYWKNREFKEDKYYRFLRRIIKRRMYKNRKFIVISVIVSLSFMMTIFFFKISQIMNLLSIIQTIIVFFETLAVLLLYDFFRNYKMTYEEEIYEIMDIIKEGENEHIEFKKDWPKNENAIAEIMIAFSNNTDGGIILMGVDDSAEITGLDSECIKDIEKRVNDDASSRCEPAIHPRISKYTIGDKQILEIAIEEYKQGVNLLKRDQLPRIRKGSTTRRPDYSEKADLFRKYS